jgi:Response regulator containing CheY-like receiver, AAA-type ATPase, and DNA-binding domains
VIFTPSGEHIGPAQLALPTVYRAPSAVPNEHAFSIPLGKSLEEVKLAYIQAVLKSSSSFAEAARILGISTKTLWEIRKRYGIELSDESMLK